MHIYFIKFSSLFQFRALQVVKIRNFRAKNNVTHESFGFTYPLNPKHNTLHYKYNDP